VDFVSYSAYDTTNLPSPDNIKSALDYIASKLQPKPGITGKRVFIGEYGYPVLNHAKLVHTPQEQDALSRVVMRTSCFTGKYTTMKSSLMAANAVSG
jgi:hypothetical protein